MSILRLSRTTANDDFLQHNQLSAGYSVEDGSYENIQTHVVSSAGAAFVEFNDIPQTYKHLQLRYSARGTDSSTLRYMRMQLNNDTSSANYIVYTYYRTSGTIFDTFGQTTGVVGLSEIGVLPGSTAGANTFGPGVIDFIGYRKPVYKTFFSISSGEDNTNSQVWYYSSMWLRNDPITKIKIFPNSGNFAQHSQLSLYGIAG